MTLLSHINEESAKEFVVFAKGLIPTLLELQENEEACDLMNDLTEKHFEGNFDAGAAYLYWLAGKVGV